MIDATGRPDITPELKVGALLDAYPELEDVLIDIAPAFRKLSNPVLRRTVARVTSLRQAASVGGVSVGQLIGTLRDAAGLASIVGGDDPIVHGVAAARPEWVADEQRVATFDARPMIEAGEMPLPVIMEALQEIAPDQIYTFVTPFLPTPIVERIEKAGYRIWTERVSAEEFRSHCALGETR